MLIVVLIEYYHDYQYYYYDGYLDSKEMTLLNYPFSTWMVEHTAEIFFANIIFEPSGIALFI